MIEGWQGEIGDRDGDGFSAPRFDLRRVDGEEDGFEPGEGSAAGGDEREIERGNYGDEGEDDEAEVGVGGEIGVVKPLAEGVVAGAGGGTGEERMGNGRVGGGR